MRLPVFLCWLLALLLLAVGPVLSQGTTHHYWYALTAPECPSSGGTDCTAYPATTGYVNVYDMDSSWTRVSTTNLPSTVKAIRGVAARVADNSLYIFNYGTTNISTSTNGRLLKLNLTTLATVWDQSYSLGAIDRGCVSADGATIYAPSGENVSSGTYQSDWYVIRTSDGVQTGLIALANGAIRPHNTVCTDGTIFMEAVDVNGGSASHHSVTMYNTATTAQTTVGNFTAGTGRVRPFTVDVPHGLVYVNLEDWIGFGVGNTAGSVLYDSQAPPGYTQPGTTNVVNSHAIALTPNGNKLYVGDPNMGAGSSTANGVEVWDVSGVRNSSAPVYKTFIATASDSHVYDGKNPGWLTTSWGGRYVVTETGEVIDTTTDTVAFQLLDPNQGDGSGDMRTRYMIEVDFQGTPPFQVSDQFGIGHLVFGGSFLNSGINGSFLH